MLNLPKKIKNEVWFLLENSSMTKFNEVQKCYRQYVFSQIFGFMHQISLISTNNLQALQKLSMITYDESH